MTKAQAAIVRSPDGPMTIEQVTLDPPGAGEVLVRIAGAGVCHTDAAMRSQQLPVPQPIVLGHEGSGIIEAIGDGVSGLAVGDPVVLSFNSCGFCPNCADYAPAYCYQFGALNFSGSRPDGSSPIRSAEGPIHGNVFGQSSFATHAIAHVRNTVPVPLSARDVPIELLGPLGCGIQTGAGAVLNSLKVKAGRSLVILGAGAVGLSAVMAARIAEASPIIAVDLHDSRRALALELGATHAIDGRAADLREQVRAILPDGAQFAFDTTGISAVIETAFELLATRGVLGLVGASDLDDTITVNETALMGGGRTIRGILEGDSDPQRFIPELIAHYRTGRFPFDRLVRFFTLEQINEAFAASERGEVVKPIIRMPS